MDSLVLGLLPDGVGAAFIASVGALDWPSIVDSLVLGLLAGGVVAALMPVYLGNLDFPFS